MLPRNRGPLPRRRGKTVKNGKETRRPPLPLLGVEDIAIPSGSAGKAKRGPEKPAVGTREQRAPDPRFKAPERAEQRLQLMANHLQRLGRERELSKAEPFLQLMEIIGHGRPVQPVQPEPRKATIPVASLPSAVPVNALNSLGASQASRGALGQTSPKIQSPRGGL